MTFLMGGPCALAPQGIVIMQGYSGKPARSPNLQGTSAVLTTRSGAKISKWGPGNSPHQAIHAKKGYIP